MDAKLPENLGALEFLKHQQKDHCHNRTDPLSITHFNRAFRIDKHVMCKAFPQHHVEWNLYEADTGDIRVLDHYFYQYHMSLVVRKLVFGVSDQVQHKPGCTATEQKMTRGLKFRI